MLISGGSGITPVMSMLRTLCDEGHPGEIAFLHYARTEADWLYEAEVRELARRHRGLERRLPRHPRADRRPPDAPTRSARSTPAPGPRCAGRRR